MTGKIATHRTGGYGIAVPTAGILLTILIVLPFSTWAASSSSGKEAISVSGLTEPIKDVTLSATMVGTITTIFVREGMAVGKGTAILEFDKKSEALEEERRKLIWESKAEVRAAAARVSTLKSLLESTRELFKSTGSVSKEELEKLELDYELAVAERERLESAEERERIEYEMARESLRKRTLTSPLQGTVVKLFLEEGEACKENEPLVRVVDASRGIFVSNVEEWIGRTLRMGQTVDLKIRTGYESIAKKGTIVFVSPVADTASGLIEVKAEFDNQDGSVRPGVSGSLLLRGR
jgi:RND family efflux transporter MFP subunit